MPGYSHKAQPYLDAIAEGLFASMAVRNWLVKGTSAESAYTDSDVLIEEQRRQRPNTKQPFWANYFCGRDSRCTCRIDGSKSLESDAIFFLRNRTGRVLAIHTEFKHANEPLSHGQPEGYPLRAACFVRTQQQRKTLNNHHDWITAIFCDKRSLADPRINESNFNRIITHFEARKMIAKYPSA